MKHLLSFFILMIVANCRENYKERGRESESLAVNSLYSCNNSQYDSLLRRYAIDFLPTSVSLGKSLSPEFNTFIATLDSSCLRKQKLYKWFINMIMAKLYLHHLSCCNQGYDLLQMKKNTAAVIITEFERIGRFQNSELEMLNSGTVIDVIKEDTSLLKEEYLSNLIQRIENESRRISGVGSSSPSTH